ncbi:hypothetical protein D3C72_489090 [compost metagenome]
MQMDGPGPPTSVVEILPEQGARRGARIIADGQIRLHPDASPRPRQPQVQLGVLVVAEGFVVAAHGDEILDPHQGVMAMIDPAAGPADAMNRPACADARVLGHGDGDLEAALAPRRQRNYHRGGAGRLGCANQPVHIVRRIIGVGVDTDQPGPARRKGPHRRIDAGAL